MQTLSMCFIFFVSHNAIFHPSSELRSSWEDLHHFCKQLLRGPREVVSRGSIFFWGGGGPKDSPTNPLNLGWHTPDLLSLPFFFAKFQKKPPFGNSKQNQSAWTILLRTSKTIQKPIKNQFLSGSYFCIESASARWTSRFAWFLRLAGWLGPCENFTFQSEPLLSSTCTVQLLDIPVGMDRLLLRLLLRECLRSQPAIVPLGHQWPPPDLEQRGQVFDEVLGISTIPPEAMKGNKKVVSVSPLGSVPAWRSPAPRRAACRSPAPRRMIREKAQNVLRFFFDDSPRRWASTSCSPRCWASSSGCASGLQLLGIGHPQHWQAWCGPPSPRRWPASLCVSLVRMAHGRLTSARFGGQLHFTDLPWASLQS